MYAFVHVRTKTATFRRVIVAIRRLHGPRKKLQLSFFGLFNEWIHSESQILIIIRSFFSDTDVGWGQYMVRWPLSDRPTWETIAKCEKQFQCCPNRAKWSKPNTFLINHTMQKFNQCLSLGRSKAIQVFVKKSCVCTRPRSMRRELSRVAAENDSGKSTKAYFAFTRYKEY